MWTLMTDMLRLHKKGTRILFRDCLPKQRTCQNEIRKSVEYVSQVKSYVWLRLQIEFGSTLGKQTWYRFRPDIYASIPPYITLFRL
jgi:hypothetical protein